MNLASFLLYFLSSFLISNATQVNSVKFLNPQEETSGSKQSYNVPFLVLMSPSEICIAQLPLIDNGSISVAYRLADLPEIAVKAGEEAHTTRSTTSADEDGSKTQTRILNADSREYEQMPRSTILGKSEWQQIAGSKFISRDREEVGARRKEDAEADERRGAMQEVNRPRRRKRSNNLVTADRSNEIGNSSGSNNNNTGSNNYTAPESSSNVTSAQFESNDVADENDEQTERETPAEDDKSNSNVQFSDFDVHMALGYAFVADSRGRIHRFRLSGFEKGNPNENLMENYGYTNAIDAAPSSTGANLAPSLSPQAKAEKHLSSNGVTADDNNVAASLGAFDVDANKVGGQSDVTHEQSGRHPVASGQGHLLLVSQREKFSFEVESFNESGTPTSEGKPSTVNQLKDEYKRNNFESAKPRIIWSRSFEKARLPADTYSQSIVGLNLNRQKSHGTSSSVKAASLDSEILATSFDQTANETEHVDGERQPQLRQQQHNLPERDLQIESEQQQTSGSLLLTNQQRAKVKEESQLKTEIAVDWLNNLLFVLDKYRLLVVDFDGNNELVLIDDFNTNNRPLDIKVDPVNDFLFWLQTGKFHNTIYKLDLNVLSMPTATERLNGNLFKLSNSRFSTNQNSYSSELVALISHHYAHPIITNLPRSARLFTIDNKHSRIYVPLPPSINETGIERNKPQRDETEIFSKTLDESNVITHMNNTNQVSDSTFYDEDRNCNSTDSNSSSGQILAYNLDGTDVGPLRSGDEKSHLSGLNDMQDLSLDSEKGFLYWLTNDGKELFEEYKTERDSSFYSAQHNLDGKKYLKLIHFDDGSNQPTHSKPRFNLRKLIHMLSTSTSTNRWTRSDGQEQFGEAPEHRAHRSGSDIDPTKYSRNAPYIILGITFLAVLSIYLIYTFIFQQSNQSSDANRSRDDSISGSSNGGSPTNYDVNSNGFIGASTISRWIAKPSAQSTDTSTFNRGGSSNGDRVDSCDIESTNYDTSNAIDEHYRDVMNNQTLFGLDNNQLAYLNDWPTHMNDMPNKLYIPVEVLQDEALSSIRRITIDQLQIERRSPLGEGHFGTVLQGTITCTLNEKNNLLRKSEVAATDIGVNKESFSQVSNQNHQIILTSSTSSGHGSSSTSSEFVTAISCAEAITTGDYLTPKSQCNSMMSDYAVENPISSRLDSCSSYYNSSIKYSNQDDLKEESARSETTLKVAIKKLKDNPSVEEKRDFLQEAKLLANFDHPNIVHLIGICLDRGSTLIVMELMLGGDLIRYMQENIPRSDRSDNLTQDDLLSICIDIVNGCCYLEELNYIHRDLAARNCLVSSRKREERVVKLADFGLARDIYKDSYYKKLNDSAMPLKWMAPECLIEQKFTTMSDIWSFGITIWEVMMFCQEKPYANVEPFLMKEHLTNNSRLRKPDNCSENIYSLMLDCWQLDPKMRPSFHECRTILIDIKDRGH